MVSPFTESLEENGETQEMTLSQIQRMRQDLPDDEPEENSFARTQQEGDSGFVNFDVLLEENSRIIDDNLLIQLSQDEPPTPADTQPTSTPYPLNRFGSSSPTESKGNPAQTPVVSKNPFGGRVQQTPGLGGHLSQLFDQTQAPTSPAEGLPSVLRSDRPSPDVDIQRYAERNLPDTTPLKTQPETPAHFLSEGRYVSIDESQAKRGKIGSRSGRFQHNDEDSWDGLVSTSRIRNRRPRSSYNKTASSPVRSPWHHIPTSSNQKRSESARPAGSRPSSAENIRSSPVDPAPFSPTQEDVGDIGTRATRDISMAPQDAFQPTSTAAIKTRRKTIVPATTQKPVRDSAALSSATQPSPSAPISAGRPPQTDVHIPNTQKSLPVSQTGYMLEKSAIDSIDRVPLSPAVSVDPTQSHQPEATGGLPFESSRNNSGDVETNIQVVMGKQEITSKNGMPVSTIPETIVSSNSNMQIGESEHPSLSNHVATEYATAQEDSSQPIKSAYPRQARQKRRASPESSDRPRIPAGQYRRRMEDASQIEDEAQAFQASQDILADDFPGNDVEMAELIDTSPSRKRLKLAELVQTFPLQMPESEQALDQAMEMPSSHEARQGTEPADTADAINDDDQFDESPRPRKRTKRSQWDILESPKKANKLKQPTAMKSHQMTKPRLKRIEKASQNVGTIPETLPAIQEESPDQKMPQQETMINESTDQLSTDPSSMPITAPNMVFAYFMDNTRHYYPATVLERGDQDNNFTIEWPGYDPEQMKDHQMCALDLRVGDEVKIASKESPGIHIVRGFTNVNNQDNEAEVTDIYGHNALILEPKLRKNDGRKSRAKKTAMIRDTFISLATFSAAVKRSTAYKTVQSAATSLEVLTPSISVSTPVTPPSRARHIKKEHLGDINTGSGIFSNMVFALSFDDQIARDHVRDLVRQTGGTILESSFQELLTDELTLKPKFADIGFTALLADKHSRKPKYMEALALGLPCLSGEWAKESVEQEEIVPWQDYLLPAGESSHLNGAVRSRVMPPSFSSDSKLSTTLAERKAFFNDFKAVFVAGKGKTAERRAPHYFLAQVMGVSEIAKVADLAAAQTQLRESREQRWLFVDDKDRKAAENMVVNFDASSNRSKGKRKSGELEPEPLRPLVADSEFLLQSLIFGRLIRHVRHSRQ